MKLLERIYNSKSWQITLLLSLAVITGTLLGSDSVHPILALIVCGSAIAILLDPFIGVVFFIARGELGLQLLLGWFPGVNPELPSLGYALIGLTLISHIGRKRHSLSPRSLYALNNVDIGILAWVVSVFLSWAVAEIRGMNVAGVDATLQIAVQALFCGIVYLLFRILLVSASQIGTLLDLMILGGVVRSIDALSYGFFGQGLYPLEYKALVESLPYQRIYGIMGDANYTANSLIVPAAVVIYRLVNCQRGLGMCRRIALWFSLLVIITALVLSYSRAAWIAMTVVYFAVLITARRRSNVLLLGTLMGVIILATGIEAFVARISNFLDATSRLFTFAIALSVWKEDWLTGVGPGNYILQSLRHGGFIGTAAAHNTYAEVLATTGLVGEGAFLFLCYSVWKGYVRCRRQFARAGDVESYRIAEAMTIGFLGWLVSIVFLSVNLDYRVIPYFALSGVLLNRTKSLEPIS